ncbi:MAG: sigma-70 family RNA polymerase sigma factor [Pirellulaceae bacterium]
MSAPETRASLLLRIRDPQDRDAWREFSSLYRPIVLEMAKRRGMQNADAEDLAQHVLVAISQAIERFEPDNQRAKFRTWLATIARRAIINALTRGPVDRAAGGSGVMSLLNEQTAVNEQTQTLSLDYRRQIFVAAANKIRDEFQSDTWEAFWQSVVEGVTVDEVAKRMGRSRGSVYTARSRVMARLKEIVQELDVRDES